MTEKKRLFPGAAYGRSTLTGRGPRNIAQSVRDSKQRPLWLELNIALQKLDGKYYTDSYQVIRSDYDRYIAARQVLIAALNIASSDYSAESVTVGKHRFYLAQGLMLHKVVNPTDLINGVV